MSRFLWFTVYVYIGIRYVISTQLYTSLLGFTAARRLTITSLQVGVTDRPQGGLSTGHLGLLSGSTIVKSSINTVLSTSVVTVRHIDTIFGCVGRAVQIELLLLMSILSSFYRVLRRK